MGEKHLVKSFKVKKEVPRLSKTQDSDSIYIKTTPQVIFEDDLPDAIKKKLLFKKPDIVSTKLHYVACWRVRMHFHIAYLSSKRNASGELEFIVDPIKGCCANEEELDLKLRKIKVKKEEISDKCFAKEEAERKAVTDARWKVLLNRYKQPAQIEVLSVSEFFRPYYEVEVLWGSKQETQNIIADDFSNYFTYSS